LLVIVAGLCGITGLGAIGASLMQNDLIAVIGVVTALSLLVLTRSFGHTEMNLLSTRLRRLTGSMLTRSAPVQTVLHDEKVHLNGDHNWQNLWETLTAFAERFEMDAVELMVNLPQIGEVYHASWKRKTNTATHQEWKSEIPLIVQDMRVGHIRVVGAVGEGSICKWMSELIGGLEGFEAELVTLVEDLRHQKLGSRTPLPPTRQTSDKNKKAVQSAVAR
jgi:UDP-GlcNAc:undecaprenyl-phosphate/decaprenyl-phosphate GlcNAc-1-phosphate transferase